MHCWNADHWHPYTATEGSKSYRRRTWIQMRDGHQCGLNACSSRVWSRVCHTHRSPSCCGKDCKQRQRLHASAWQLLRSPEQEIPRHRQHSLEASVHTCSTIKTNAMTCMWQAAQPKGQQKGCARSSQSQGLAAAAGAPQCKSQTRRMLAAHSPSVQSTPASSMAHMRPCSQASSVSSCAHPHTPVPTPTVCLPAMHTTGEANCAAAAMRRY